MTRTAFLKNGKVPGLCLLTLLVLLVCVSPTLAQSESGSAAMEGLIVDSNGAVVAGATVKIRNVDTGLERTASTNSRGRFNAPVLPVGRYIVRADATGFAPGVNDDVRLIVGETATVNLIIAPTSVREEVTITSDAETLDTEAPATSSTIPSRAVSDLPIRGRNFTEFVQLTPAVEQEADRGGLVISGQRSINSNVAIDGADYNDALQGNQRGGAETAFFFPQTAVREFQVVRSGANAEIGRTNAGFVNVVTKSGTNDIRGEAFYFNRNRKLTSPNAFGRSLDNAQSQLGGSIGGPLIRDRAFFFFGIEQNYLRVPFVVEFAAPPAGVVLPTEILDQEGEKRGTNNPTALFARTDFVLSNSHTLNVQYTHTRLRGENFNFDSPRIDQAETANYARVASSNGLKTALVSVMTPRVVNEIRFQVATDYRIEDPNLKSPSFIIAGFGQLGGDHGRPRRFDTLRYQIADNLSFSVGAHRLRFGIDANVNKVRQQRESNTQGRYDFETRGGVSAIENFIANRPRRFRQSVPGADPDALIFRGTVKELALFVQDTVAISRNITLNAGFRWEGQWNPQPLEPNPLVPETARIPNDLRMFQPRLGLAWDVAGKGNTVLRLSAGLYSARTPANLFQRVFTNNGLSAQEVEIPEVGGCRDNPSRMNGCRLRGPDAILTFPNVLTSIPTNFIVAPRIFGFQPDFRNPQSFQTSATLEQRLDSHLVFSAGFIHNSTWNLQRRLDRNLFPPTIDETGTPIFPVNRPNPNIGRLSINESSAHSSYDALVMTLTRRFSQRYQIQANYTLARNRDDDSNERNFSGERTFNPFDLTLENAYSKQDVRHSFNLNGLIDLGRGFSLSGIIITRSGFPYTPVIGFDIQNDGNDDNDRAIINGRAFERNSFRQPFFFNFDVRLLKAFRFGETKRLDFSAEVFNVTRNTNKNFGNDSISEFGTPSAPVATAGEPRFAPSTARFGGPRQLQLGVRFVF